MTARRGSLSFWLGKSARRSQRQMQHAMMLAGRIIATAAVGLFALVYGAQAWRLGYADYQLSRQIASVEDRNRVLEAQAVTLRREIYLSHNPEYLVPLIHDQLGLAKPREVFVRIVTVPNPATHQ